MSKTFESTIHWYQIINIDPRNKNSKIGDVYGQANRKDELIEWGYESGKFYEAAKLRYLGHSCKNANESDVRKWLDKQIAKLSQDDNGGKVL